MPLVAKMEGLDLGQKYLAGGAGDETLKKMKRLRNERLAHRQLAETVTIELVPEDQDIEAFYADTVKLVENLVGLVLGAACDPAGVGATYRHHAEMFWAGARGERIERHPGYDPARRP